MMGQIVDEGKKCIKPSISKQYLVFEEINAKINGDETVLIRGQGNSLVYGWAFLAQKRMKIFDSH
jgi:hypothetical protein